MGSHAVELEVAVDGEGGGDDDADVLPEGRHVAGGPAHTGEEEEGDGGEDDEEDDALTLAAEGANADAKEDAGEEEGEHEDP